MFSCFPTSTSSPSPICRSILFSFPSIPLDSLGENCGVHRVHQLVAEMSCFYVGKLPRSCTAGQTSHTRSLDLRKFQEYKCNKCSIQIVQGLQGSGFIIYTCVTCAMQDLTRHGAKAEREKMTDTIDTIPVGQAKVHLQISRRRWVMQTGVTEFREFGQLFEPAKEAAKGTVFQTLPIASRSTKR